MRSIRDLTAVIAVTFALALTGCAAGTGPSATGQKIGAGEIAIGVAGPMTGQLTAFGEQLQKGAAAAVADINAKGGVLGKQLHLVVGDDGCDPHRAVQVAGDLVKQGVVFVDGHFCSGASIPASEVYAETGTLQITPSSTNPYFTDHAASQGVTTVFRMTNRDDMQGIFAGNWLAKTYAGRKLAILDDESSYGRGVADTTAVTVKSAGLSPALRETYRQKSSDFSSLIAKLKGAKIDIVYIGGYHNDVGLMVRQAREQGFKGDFASDDALNTSEFWSISGPAGDGVRFSDADSPMRLASAQQAFAKFRSQGFQPEGYVLNAYAAVQAFAAAANATGSTDGRKMAEWLHKNPAQTVLGDVAWDEKGDLRKSTYAWYIWHGGTYAEELPN